MRGRDSGFALVLVIWALVLLASLSTGFAYAVRHQLRAATDMADAVRAEAAATAALHTAILGIGSANKAQRWRDDARARSVTWPDAIITVRVRSEMSRIDINRAPRELLSGLFTQLFDQADVDALVDAVIDWRDPDDRRSTSGAEKEEYQAAGRSYAPSNTPFHSVNELGRVLGFNNRMLEAARPYLTVHSRQPRISAASADLVVLSSIPGIDREAAQAFLAGREQAFATDGVLDYRSLGQGAKYLDTRVGNRMYLIDIQVRLHDGLEHRESVVIQLHNKALYNLVAREVLPMRPAPERPSQ